MYQIILLLNQNETGGSTTKRVKQLQNPNRHATHLQK